MYIYERLIEVMDFYISRPSFVFGEGLIQRNLYQVYEKDRERSEIGYKRVEGF